MRAKTHDFGDQKGSVPAHQHKNGGGWVSDDSTVSEDSYVSAESVVFDGSRVERSTVGGSIVERSTVEGSTVEGSRVERSTVDGSRVEGSHVTKSEDVLPLGSLGSREDTLTAIFNQDCGIRVATGCWSGTLDEFEARVREVHGDNEYGREYQAAITFIRALAPLRQRPLRGEG